MDSPVLFFNVVVQSVVAGEGITALLAVNSQAQVDRDVAFVPAFADIFAADMVPVCQPDTI